MTTPQLIAAAFFSSDSVCKLPDFYALSGICAVSPSRMVMYINVLWLGVLGRLGKECETPITRERIPSLACYVSIARCFPFAFSATSCGVKRCCECWLCCCERFWATFLSIGLSSSERWMQHVACLIFMILIIAIFSVHLMKSCFLLRVNCWCVGKLNETGCISLLMDRVMFTSSRLSPKSTECKSLLVYVTVIFTNWVLESETNTVEKAR